MKIKSSSTAQCEPLKVEMIIVLALYVYFPRDQNDFCTFPIIFFSVARLFRIMNFTHALKKRSQRAFIVKKYILWNIYPHTLCCSNVLIARGGLNFQFIDP